MDKFKTIDFGEIEGSKDEILSEVFVDENFIIEIKDKRKYFIIGRKGTGISAIFTQFHDVCLEEGILCKNINMLEFDFSSYIEFSQSVNTTFRYYELAEWLLLVELCKLVANDPLFDGDNDTYKFIKLIKKKFDLSLDRLDEKSVSVLVKHETGVDVKIFKHMRIVEKGKQNDNISLKEASTILKKELKGFFSKSSKRYIIQLDGLDEHDSKEISEQYTQFLLSFFKVAEELNKVFSFKKKTLQINIFLRSDIFNRFHKLGANTAKWVNNILVLEWIAKRKTHFSKGSLRRLVNKRISNSIDIPDGVDPWNYVMKEDEIDRKIQKYFREVENEKYSLDELFEAVVNKTFHRPRDIVQFCIYLQKYSSALDFSYDTINDVMGAFNKFLWNDLSNELSGTKVDINMVVQFLEFIGKNVYDLKKLVVVFNRLNDTYKIEGLTYDEFLRILFTLGLIVYNDKKWYATTARIDLLINDYDASVTVNPFIFKALKDY